MAIPRPEHPRPQFVRDEWLNLNGRWRFEIDCGDSGLERGLLDRDLEGTITVPFCPESGLSGVEHVDFMNAVWYRRKVAIPADWQGRRIHLHFQAVDYDATVWVEGREVGRHRGGFTPFTCDISGVASPGEEVTIVVRARDYTRRAQPGGKQVKTYANRGCHYTRTTGVWQTVWMEAVPDVHLRRARITPDVANGRFILELPVSDNRPGWRVTATLRDGTGVVARARGAADLDLTPQVILTVPEDRRRLWCPEDPFLYDLKVELADGKGNVVDGARSYAGLRSVSIDGKAIRINGEKVFQRLVLDQGYYPDGIMTAPSDEALRRDIELSMEAGFNGARLHQKVFEERFLYHADRLGYLVWGEFGDWGFRGQVTEGDRHQPAAALMAQWAEVLGRDYSHPSIIGWCPLNETMEEIGDHITMLDDVTRGLYHMTKAADPTRPALDASGYSHRVPGCEVYDCHDYDQNAETMRERHAGLAENKAFANRRGEEDASLPYAGQPYFVSEFGGIWWNPDAKPGDASWGYGERPKDVEEFYRRFESLCSVLLDNPRMFGYCYTQLTDVFQEQNGIYRFDRRSKFDTERLREVQRRPAAIEKEGQGNHGGDI